MNKNKIIKLLTINNVEIWRDVIGYEGLYKVSNLGRIKSLNRKISSNKRVKGVIRSQQKNENGYMTIQLHKNNTIKDFKVHRLVAQAFIPNPNNLPQVNHKDENKTNNNLINLEWCTSKYNNSYGTKIERSIAWCRKKVYQYDTNFNLIKIYESITECVRQTGYDRKSIENRCNLDEIKLYKNFIWRYSSITNEDKNIYLPKTESEKKKVYQYDLNLKLVNIYESLSECSKITGFNRGTISKRCNINDNKPYKNFIWRFNKL